MRPADWSPLAESDPVPGDPVTLRELADHLVGVAQNIRDQNSRMAELDAGSIWDSEAAVTFTEMQEALPPDLETAATRYEGVANALFTYEAALGSAQSLADAALRRAQDAWDDLQAAEGGIGDMEDWQDEAQRRADEANEGNDGPRVEPEEWSGTDYYALRDDANERLEQARADLETAVGDRDDAAGTAEAAIDEASDDDLTNPGFWEQVALIACDVLAVAGAVLGILSIFFPVLAPLALLVGLASLALTTTLWLTTDLKDGGDVLWDLAAVATFGLGRAFMVAGRAIKAAPALRSARTSQAVATQFRNIRNFAATRRAQIVWNAPGRYAPGTAPYTSTIRSADEGFDLANANYWRHMQQWENIRYPSVNNWAGWSNARSTWRDLGSGNPYGGWGITGQWTDLTSTGVGIHNAATVFGMPQADDALRSTFSGPSGPSTPTPTPTPGPSPTPA